MHLWGGYKYMCDPSVQLFTNNWLNTSKLIGELDNTLQLMVCCTTSRWSWENCALMCQSPHNNSHVNQGKCHYHRHQHHQVFHYLHYWVPPHTANWGSNSNHSPLKNHIMRIISSFFITRIAPTLMPMVTLTELIHPMNIWLCHTTFITNMISRHCSVIMHNTHWQKHR